MRSIILGMVILIMASCNEPAQVISPPLKLDDATKPLVFDYPVEQTALLSSTRLEPFSSPDDFGAYLDALRAKQHDEFDGYENDCPNCDTADMPLPSAGAAESGITNNQENGVDEGGIVKTAGDYLVVLRRGRLFSIRMSQGAERALLPVDAVDAFPSMHTTQTWYDELLIHEHTIIVIGYSYGYGATEIGLFHLDDDGKISHQSTNFLRSSDYYSSRNYASRLVGHTLVFYTPYYFFDRFNEREPLSFPSQAQLQTSGGQSGWQAIINETSIIKPIEETLEPVLHTITTCDLSRPEFICTATAVIGPPSRSFYVSPTAVFLWTAGEEGSGLYRLPLDGSSPTALRAVGVPTDQFSFKETDDGYLHVLLRENGNGDAMWSPEFRDGGVALLSVPLTMLSDEPRIAAISDYALLPKVDGLQMHNRFVGHHVLYGAEDWWGTANNTTLQAYNLTTKTLDVIDLGHDVQRIEALGDNALVVGAHEHDVKLSSVALKDKPERRDTYIIRNASQGERRSHGFFYKQHSFESGILGLPMRAEAEPFSELREASASILFMEVTDLHLHEIGSLVSNTAATVDDHCIASCIDWYGNSRPIFLGDRLLGLMGYDLVEGTVVDGALTEIERINYMPAAGTGMIK